MKILTLLIVFTIALAGCSPAQRQLRREGTSYREILESMRRSLAEKHLKDGAYSQAQVAFMIGFADQSNLPAHSNAEPV